VLSSNTRSGGGENIIPAYSKNKFPLVIGYNTEAFAKFTCKNFDIMLGE
jgi:hypothetical protein